MSYYITKTKDYFGHLVIFTIIIPHIAISSVHRAVSKKSFMKSRSGVGMANWMVREKKGS